MRSNLISITCLFFALSTSAQPLVEADTNAVYSVNGIVAESHRLVSAEAGKARNLEALRNLFLPTAQLTVLYHSDDTPAQPETVSLDEFMKLLEDPYYDEASFVEYETGKIVNEYNGIANVFQSFSVKDSEGLEAGGINSFQLVYFEDRWWIAHMLWTGDDNGVGVPERYLEK